MPRGKRDKGRRGEGEKKESGLGRLCRMSAPRAIKNITRDECNSVYLAAERERYAALLYLFGHCRSANQSRKKRENSERG